MRAWIGIGSNLGDRIGSCSEGARGLGEIPGTRLLKLSSFYLTEPVAMPPCEWFVNAVAELETDLAPETVLEQLLALEQRFGRERQADIVPRTLDLDLLDAGGMERADARLTLPHPRMHHRRFQLLPLAEVAPAWRHPTLGRTAADLLAGLDDTARVVRIARLGRTNHDGAR